MVNMKTPRRQLDAFIAKYDPHIAATAKKCLVKLRKLAPGANQLVYDNYQALVIAFGAGERPSDVVFSLALYPRHLNLFFLWGKGLPDPGKRLQGAGQQVRSVRVNDAATLDEPEVLSLLRAAMARAKVPFDSTRKGQLEIRAVVKAQRPRRPASR